MFMHDGTRRQSQSRGVQGEAQPPLLDIINMFLLLIRVRVG